MCKRIPKMTSHLPPGPRYHALLELLRTSESLWNGSRLFFARWDLSPSQFNILNLLSGAPEGCSQVELSRQLIMHRSNLTGMVDRLEERGLVKRRSREGDRRANRVLLTGPGLDLVREILPHYHQAAEAVWAGISPANMQVMVKQLSLLRRNLETLTPTLSTYEIQP